MASLLDVRHCLGLVWVRFSPLVQNLCLLSPWFFCRSDSVGLPQLLLWIPIVWVRLSPLMVGVVQGWVAGDDVWMLSHGGLVQGSIAAQCSIALELVAAMCSFVCCAS